MYKLVVNNREINDFDPSEFAALATWRTKLINKVNTFATFSAKTGTLPVTKELNAALNSPLVVDSYSKPSVKPEIQFYTNDELLIDGYIQVKGGSINQIGGEITFNIHPKTLDWVEDFKNFTMQEVDLDDQAHQMSENAVYFSNHVRVSWSHDVDYYPVDVGYIGYRSIIGMHQDLSLLPTVTTTVLYTGEDIGTSTTETVEIVGCPNSSANGTFDLTGTSSAYWAAANVLTATTTDIPQLDDPHLQIGFFQYNAEELWRIHDFIPSAPLDLLLERAFSKVGYSIKNSWYSDNLSQHYHYEYHKDVWSKGFDARTRFAVGIQDGGFALTGTTGTTTMPFVIKDAPGLLNNDNYVDTDSDDVSAIAAGTHSSYWEAPEDCYMSFKAHVRIFAQATSFRMVVRDGGGTLIASIDSKSTSGHEHDLELMGCAFVAAGNRVSVEMLLSGSTYTPFLLEDAVFEGRQIQKIIDGMEIHPADFQTDKTAYEWFKDLSLFWGLQFYTNPFLKQITIIPDEDKMIEKVEDWTNKSDKKCSITQISSLHPSSYVMDYVSDSVDYEMSKREAISGRFARGTITNDDVFATGTTSIELNVYAASINGAGNFYDFVDLGIPVMKGENGERLDYVSRIFTLEYDSTTLEQYIEGSTSNLFWDFESQQTTAINRAQFPSTMHFDSLIDNYYQRFGLILKYGYILKGSFDVKPSDIAKFNQTDQNAFRSRISIEVDGIEVDAELLSVQDYEPTSDTHTLCELIWLKINN